MLQSNKNKLFAGILVASMILISDYTTGMLAEIAKITVCTYVGTFPSKEEAEETNIKNGISSRDQNAPIYCPKENSLCFPRAMPVLLPVDYQ